ncbi:anti-sigma factor family protein [Allorhizocola rhizosphaerae]|uniref:anti-sigma factor family protein n=1 Tax=Allorhizocola rhizosphaerae TaxID=1872709 RepID=UPI000E3EDF50|nr:zf-HC2 domain-containing protein [Allorhizocola rhizosphaerae]
MRCEYAFDDGAYVLGALSPAERDRYEKHLATCAQCREAVASLAVLPGLLGRLSPDEVPMALGSQVSEQRLPRLISTVAVRRRRQRRHLAVALVLTACAAVFAGLALGTARTTVTQPPVTTSSPASTPTATPPQMHAMRPMEGVPVTAQIAVIPADEGTKVRMKCWYPPDPEHSRRYSFFLVAYGHDGEREQVSSWTAGAGDDVTVTGTVRLPMEDLLRLEVQKKDGTTLLVYDIP